MRNFVKLIFIGIVLIAIAVIVIFAIYHIAYTVSNYNNILTALPLWMMVVIETSFWGVLVLGSLIIFVIVLKHFNK